MTALLRAMGGAIDAISRAIYRKAFGLRIPASRIRMADIEADRDFIVRRLEESASDTEYWRGQLDEAEWSLEQARHGHELLLRKCRRTGGNPIC